MSIVTQEPKVQPNGRYSVKETAKLLGVHRNTLLKYTNKGTIRCGIRRSTTRKFYTGMEIIRFWRAQL